MTAKTLSRTTGSKVASDLSGKKKTKSTAAHILSAPKGPRTVSHRKIKDAVEKVFRERTQKSA